MSTGYPSVSFQWRIVTALLVVHIVLAAGSIRQTSLTWDEPSYIGVGRLLLETRSPEIKALQLHPPLSYHVNSVLLLPLEFEPDRFRDEQYIHHKYIGPSLVFDSGYPPSLMMFLVRIPFVVLSALLGALVFRWSREIYGPTAAAFSAFFYTLCPTVLAHCGLATADLLLALNMTLALYCLNKCLDKPSRPRLVLTGMALGLSLLTKFTGLILIPTFLFLSFMRWRKSRTRSAGPDTPRRLALKLVIIFGIATVVVWAGYGFQFGTPFMPEWLEPEAERLIQEKPFWHAVDTLAKKGLRVPAYSYILGIYTQLAAAKSWKDNFLFGQISSKGWWYFYWAAFLIKTPLPFMICLLAALGMRRNSAARKEGESYLLLSMLPMVIFFSLPTRINIGIRYILPLLPLLSILAGKVATIKSKTCKLILALLCIWYAGSALWIHPHYLAYFNESVGGPGKGYKYLVDSNLDWGQSLDDLADHLQENGVTNPKIKYFGPPEVMKYYGLENADPNDCGPSPGTWIISATYLQNLYLADRSCHDWLRELEPNKVIGYSIFIYEVSEKQISRTDRPHLMMNGCSYEET